MENQNRPQPVSVDDDSFEDKVLGSELPVVVDFWAPWCGPCRMVAPILDEFAGEFAGKLQIAKVNTDENPMRASTLGIMGIPTMIFFHQGKEVDRLVGALPKPALKERFEAFLERCETAQV